MGLGRADAGGTPRDERNPVVLTPKDSPVTLFEIAVDPTSWDDREKTATAIRHLAREDPSLQGRIDRETGRAVIGGEDAPRLQALIDRMRREHRVDAAISGPQVAYRKTIRRKAGPVEVTYSKQTGGAAHYARVWLSVEPITDGTVYEFIDRLPAGCVPAEYVSAVDAGCREAMRFSPPTGHPMIGVRVALLDAREHEIDSWEGSFRVAGALAFRKAVRQAAPVLLEPVMAVELTVPAGRLDGVTAGIEGRRGEVRAVRERPGARVVDALVPLAEMGGRPAPAGGAMRFDHYAEVPARIAEKLTEQGAAG